MANVSTISKTVVSGVVLELTVEEAKALTLFIGRTSHNARMRDHQLSSDQSLLMAFLYDNLSGVTGAL